LASELEGEVASNKPSIQPPEQKKDRLNKLFEDSDDDEQNRLNKQKKLSEKYKEESKTAAPVQKPPSKLFQEDEDEGFSPNKQKVKDPSPILKDPSPILKEVSKGPSPLAKKDLFDDDEPVKKLPERKSIAKKKGLFDDDEDEPVEIKPKESKPSLLAPKGGKKGLFDDGEEDISPSKAIQQKPKESLKPIQKEE
jgi:hypothetical protein